MLTGEVPFDDPRSVIKILHKHICATVIPPRQRRPGLQIPDTLEALVLQMLAKQREDRLASMQELEQQLTKVLKTLRPKVSITPVETVRSGGVAKSGASRVGKARRLTVVLPLVLAVLGGGSYAVYRSLRPSVQSQGVLDYTARLALRNQAIALLRAQLADPDKRVRARAADALAHSGDTSVRTELEGLLNDPDPEVLSRAVDGLGRLGDHAAVSALLALQQRVSGSALSIAVATALDRLGVPNQLELLRKVMRTGSGEQRVRAAYLLTERGDREAREQLHALVVARALPDAVQISVLAVLSQHGDADASAQLLAQLDGSRAEQEKLSLAAPLSRVGEDRGTRYLQELARRPGPTQVLASRVLIAVGQSTASDLDVLRSILKTPEASTAALLTAMDGIGEGGGDADLGVLEPFLRQKNARVSQAAAAAIVEITGRDPAALSEQSLQWAGAALGAPNWEMREAAVGMLGELRSASVVSMLGKVVVQDAESRVRRGAAKALGQHETREAVSALRQALTDSDSSVRLETLTALLRLMTGLGSRADAELRQSVRSVLLSRLNKGSGQEQALISAGLLQLGDEAQRAGLRQALTDADSAVRRIALLALDTDTAALTTALTDNDPSLRLLAARRLATRGDAAGLMALRSLRDAGGRWGAEAYGVLRKLGDSGSPPSGLSKQLDGADKSQRLALLDAMAEMPAEESRPLLLRMLHDSDTEVRNQALTALAQQPGSDPLLRSLLKEEDPSLRARAAALFLQRASAGTSVSTPTPSMPVAAVVKAPSTSAAVTAQATEPGAEASQGTERAPDAGLIDLQSAGLAALRRNDYSKAQKSFEKIVGMCGRKSQALSCGAVQTSAMFGLGQVYEAQSRAADAIAMYERTLSAQGVSRARSEDRARAQESMKRLTLQMGKIIVRKKEHNSCKSVTLWMSPGTHRINLGGNQMKWVPVQAGGSVEIDGCK
jgi:HEAT repeat protein